jgi:ectoine hydroxylase-related dioxygenase (phytanoyl-CoA dioxygenase family)
MDQSSFNEHGFAIIPSVLADPDISKLEQAFASADVRRSKAGVRHALKHSPVAEMAHDERLLEIARRVLGTGAVPFRATLFDKSPNSNWLVVWHQDTALPLCERHETPGWGPWSVKDGVIYAHAPTAALARVLALRIHLDNSTADNGPLRVLPATHKMGVLSDDAIHKLAEEVTSVDCLVPRGGVLAMRPLIVHASSKSRSEMNRRVSHIEYAASRFTEDGLELAVA